MKIIGRVEEQKRLLKKLDSDKSELIAVTGRRRVGKTFLIRSTFSNQILFQMTGLYKGNMPEHMDKFTKLLYDAYHGKYEIVPPTNWFEAFALLEQLILEQKSKKKKIIFLDEFPWMATNKSRFLTAFTDFWNEFVSTRTDIIIVICGSSASWMINKILKNKGGLHNRVTDRFILEPFNLHETELFFKSKSIPYVRQDLAQLYMAIGGIPYYLDQIEKGESITKAMDRICFVQNSILHLEYNELMASLFDNSENHLKIIEILCKHPQGLTRNELIVAGKFTSGGGFTAILDELIFSSFISKEIPYGKSSNEALYVVRDPYLLFYHKYISAYAGTKNKVWDIISSLPTYKSWSGLAFENLCKWHIEQIKGALGISGIYSAAHQWHHPSTDEMRGAQIELLIDRNDNTINLCEIKFSNELFVISKDYAEKIKVKMASFRFFTKTKKTIFLTFITPKGLVNNLHYKNLVQNEILMDVLFEK